MSLQTTTHDGPRSNLEEATMTMRSTFRRPLLAACMTLALAAAAVQAQEIPVVTGDQWSKSSEQVKKAYLVGIANLLQVEASYQAPNPPATTQSLIPRASKGLQGQTLDSVQQKLDSWYAANPTKLQRPVIETIWFEIVVPGSPLAK